MSKRINNVSIEEIKSNTKRIKAEDEQPRQQNDDVDNQLSVYNSNNSDGDDDEEEVYHPEEDQRLCVFKTPSVTRAVTWVDELRYNLQAKNLTVLRCDVAFNKLFECLSFLRESLPLDNYLDRDQQQRFH
uniref:DNA binding protein n=1 Tax=Spodoptera exigua multiple nucleopolyhedrovirus TaxID=10454 RepID=A0A6N0C2Y9_9ABAC|nr:DNA binding protein [Spodoptera exigua multiple nucleopolyhedrovirus]